MQQRQALAEDVGAFQPGVGALRILGGEGVAGLLEGLFDGDVKFGFHGVFLQGEVTAVNTL
ncbi:hypothetical protein D3C84_1184370 [compost metagenome]